MVPASPSPADFAPVDRVVIVGLGLMGGGLARTLRARKLAREIVTVGRRPDELAPAIEAGLVDRVSGDGLAEAAQADLVFLCQPVDIIRDEVGRYIAAAPAQALITDVGSTKSAICSAAQAAAKPGRATFVGSHPMAGGDRTGWRNSPPDLFEGATTFVTSDADAPSPAAVARVVALWQSLGARVIVCHPARHDALVGLLSHAPHLTAAAFVQQVARAGEDAELLRLVAGPGFRDHTRIARSDPALWTQIALQNRDAVAYALEGTADQLRLFARLVRTGDTDALRSMLAAARELRMAIDGEGPPNTNFE